MSAYLTLSSRPVMMGDEPAPVLAILVTDGWQLAVFGRRDARAVVSEVMNRGADYLRECGGDKHAVLQRFVEGCNDVTIAIAGPYHIDTSVRDALEELQTTYGLRPPRWHGNTSAWYLTDDAGSV
jgi:hypothetical protein